MDGEKYNGISRAINTLDNVMGRVEARNVLQKKITDFKKKIYIKMFYRDIPAI